MAIPHTHPTACLWSTSSRPQHPVTHKQPRLGPPSPRRTDLPPCPGRASCSARRRQRSRKRRARAGSPRLHRRPAPSPRLADGALRHADPSNDQLPRPGPPSARRPRLLLLLAASTSVKSKPLLRAAAVDLRSRELLVRRRVGPGGGGARERDERQPLRLLPAQGRPRVHRLRCPHRRLAHPARIQVPLPQQDGLCAVAFMDDHYPVRTAFFLLNKVRQLLLVGHPQ